MLELSPFSSPRLDKAPESPKWAEAENGLPPTVLSLTQPYLPPHPHGLLPVLATLPPFPSPSLSAANLQFLTGSMVAAALHTQLGQGWDSHVSPTVQRGRQRGEGEQVKLGGETGSWAGQGSEASCLQSRGA